MRLRLATIVILEQKPKLSVDIGSLNSFNQKTNAFLSTNINISLGERVLIKAYGLSRLSGINSIYVNKITSSVFMDKLSY